VRTRANLAITLH
jgi:molybdopterin-binding protein